jgi:beta-lactamase regulating signal transducer with metallopeptidase domain
MILTGGGLVSGSSLMTLVESAVRVVALSGVAGLGLAAFRVRNTSMRLFTWTIVLYAALAMPVLEWMLPTVSVPAPALFQSKPEPVPYSIENAHFVDRDVSRPVSTEETVEEATDRSRAEMREPAHLQTPLRAPTEPSHSFLSSVSPSTVLGAAYFTVALFLLMRFFAGIVFSRRLLRASQTIDDSRLAARVATSAKNCGLAVLPLTKESELISVPFTLGALRSTILLPTSWREWDNRKLDAVITHEVSHVARRDGLTLRLSLLHRAVFWFSPLAWWLDRHLADLAEEASDEAALIFGTDRKDYARTLLGFFEALQATPGRVWWQGVSMAKTGQAEKRLERILTWKGSVAMRLKKSITVAVLMLAVPVVYFAASVHAAKAQSHTPPAVAAAPAAGVPSPAIPQSEPSSAPGAGDAPAAAPVEGTGPPVGAPVQATVAPMAPRSPVPPAAGTSRSGRSRSSYGRGFSYAYGFDDEQRFVIVSGKSDSFTMSGTSEDARHVEKLKKQISGDFIWFQRDEKSYIIRDQATVDRARKLWAPQEELGKKQEALGKQQEELGKQQEALGAKMEQVHVNVPDMTAELDKLRAELKQLSSTATMEQIGHIQSEIGELQSKIGDLQSKAGDQQGILGEQMGALGEKQGKLGEEQGELGRQQGELAEKASQQMKQLLDEAISKGIAQLEL